LAYGRSGDYEKAIEDFSMGIKLNPNSVFNYYNRGIAYEKLGKKIEAYRDFKRAAKLGHKPAEEFVREQGVK